MTSVAGPIVERGDAPLIVSLPHAGTEIPSDIAATLADGERAVRDTDWHVDKLYGFAAGIGATIITTPWSRTVIDVNRDPSGRSLYPGAITTELCPSETFEGQPLYAGTVPDPAEIERRKALYYQPYHDALAAEIDRLRGRHPQVLLWEGHSIQSRLPRLFDGTLPSLNIGTNSGRSASPALIDQAERDAATSGFSWIRDGRFKGGWITRSYGQPGEGVHAIQLELTQCSYLADERAGCPAYDAAFAKPVTDLLGRMLANQIACLQLVN